MDASDIIRKLQAKTIYTNYKITLADTQPPCNFSTCTGVLYTSTCIVNYPDYQLRNNVLEGKAACAGCSVICGYGGSV